ncbi:MAG: hypothetical protein WA763_05090 [Pseudolabrys sp.]
MSQPASLTWLAGHEFRLGWRDWTSLMTAGGRTRARTATIALTAFAAFMHVFAFWTVASYANADLASDTSTFITGSLLLSWSLLLSQIRALISISSSRRPLAREKCSRCAWAALPVPP